jgi:hypothetical protein
MKTAVWIAETRRKGEERKEREWKDTKRVYHPFCLWELFVLLRAVTPTIAIPVRFYEDPKSHPNCFNGTRPTKQWNLPVTDSVKQLVSNMYDFSIKLRERTWMFHEISR